ncbi:MotA/TolQ/ExbB proton channel family protein [Aurantivibrio plasticivorans]
MKNMNSTLSNIITKLGQSLFLFVLIAGTVSASSLPTKDITTLNDLMDAVKTAQVEGAIENQQRLEQFKREQRKQQHLMDIRKAIAEKEALGKSLQSEINLKREEVSLVNEELEKALGNFGELFGVTRQVAAETQAHVGRSLISAEFPDRAQRLVDIAQSEGLPSMGQLRDLWLILLQEQTEQGRVSLYPSRVHDVTGAAINTEVTRLGAFVAIANGKYVVMDNGKEHLRELARQPNSEHVRQAKQVMGAAPGDLVTATIDPSGGAILQLLVQTPDLMERFHQGGVVGYVVSVLAVIGVLIGLQRLIGLWFTSRRVQLQMRQQKPVNNNPLGRVLAAYEDNPNADVETLELKLDDAVYKEIPKLEKGLNTLKVLAAVAPLMGLLGTVVGMILTFQTITLWGAGDPKLMAGGISQALMTTVQGLVAAIPLLLLHSIASGRARELQQILQEQCAGLVAQRAEVKHG